MYKFGQADIQITKVTLYIIYKQLTDQNALAAQIVTCRKVGLQSNRI